MQIKIYSFALVVLIAACTAKNGNSIDVVDAWIAEIPPVISVTAALMTLRNNDDTPRYLVAASSPNAEKIEIHKSFVVNDLARMQQQAEVEIPARGTLSFNSETGYHLMFYGAAAIKAGQQIPVTLEFKDGSKISILYEVRDRRNAE